jgi:hypothetical protein
MHFWERHPLVDSVFELLQVPMDVLWMPYPLNYQHQLLAQADGQRPILDTSKYLMQVHFQVDSHWPEH